MSIIIKSGNSGNLAAVTDANELAVGLPANPLTAGFVKVASAGGNPLSINNSGYLAVGQDNLVFSDSVDGASLNTNLWNMTGTATMTVAQSSGVIALNAAAIQTAATSAQINSNKHIPLHGAHPVAITMTASINVGAQTNATREMGIGLASGNAAPTDGMFFRWNSNGVFQAVINNAGVETYSAPLTAPSNDTAHQYIVYIENERVTFLIDMLPVAVVARPLTQSFPVSQSHLPIFARVYNGAGTPATAPRLLIGQSIAIQTTLNTNRDWQTALAGIGRGAYQNPLSFGQTANHANSTAPTSAALSNSTPSYATLGGRFQFAAVAGSATDYALFGFQVPSGYQMLITGVAIKAMNLGAANGATAIIMDWSVGLNSSAGSLATADSAGLAWSPRRIPLGLMAIPAGAAVGVPADPDLDFDFTSPLAVDSGRYFHLIVSVPVGLATANQVIRGVVLVNGYFE